MNWKAFNSAMFQATLRMVPILPVNELYAALRSISEGEKEVDKQVEEAVCISPWIIERQRCRFACSLS
ncbi:hypothetical protein DXT91_24485 [Agrobacterium tumefaciens]|nr:hypothetical protein [Agrobacterium tumefaciens]